MRNELNYIENIENYLEGKLTVEENMLFENKLKTDETLRNNTELQKQLTERIKLNAFRNEVMNFHEQFAMTSKWKFKGIWLNIFIGVLMLGSASASIYYFSGDDKTGLPIGIKNNLTVNSIPVQTIALVDTSVAKNVPAKFVRNPNWVRPTIITPLVEVPKVEPIIDIPKDETPCKNFLQTFNTATIDAELGGDIITKDSKSTIHIPGKIMMDKNFNDVKGMVEIRYREFRNSAQTAFSKIPMVYTENNIEHNFNSAGMFEIRAFQNDELVEIKPGKIFKVDYNVTNKVDSCFFFGLDDKNQVWKKLKPIEFKQNEINVPNANINPDNIYYGQLFAHIVNVSNGKVIENATIEFTDDKSQPRYSNVYIDSGYNVSRVFQGQHEFWVNAKGFKRLRVKKVTIKEGKITSLEIKLAPKNPFYKFATKKYLGSFKQDSKFYDEMPIKGKVKSGNKISFHIFQKRRGGDLNVENFVDNLTKPKDNGSRTNDTLLAEGLNAGYSYASLVKGLQCSSFGVYNCDQAMRINDRLMVNATYKDMDGNAIENLHVLSMIDLKYNGAFSFSPQQFTCSKGGRNVLLLFTNDAKLYALTEEDYKKMQLEKSGNYDFTMSNITDKVKNSDELKKFLGIK